jgi:hypothetical protein
MIALTHRTLANALDALIGGDGPLPLRLGRAAEIVATLSPGDFDDHRLRRKFRELRDDLVFMDAVGRDAADLDAAAAMTLALRFLDLVFSVASRAISDG